MDALPDQKQLQLETRQGQTIDKMVNPPLVADVQLKNQPANPPGGVTLRRQATRLWQTRVLVRLRHKFPVQEITEDLTEVKTRLSQIFFNDVLWVSVSV